jgi:hypothetical protein
MRLIEAADAELFEAMSLAGRMGRAARMLERLDERYRRDPDDPEAAFRYALGALATLPTAASELEVYGRFGGVVESLDRTVSAVPEHWLARYLRIRLRCLSMASHSASEPEFASVEDEIDALITLQEEAQWQPYFAAAFVLASRLAEWPGRARDSSRVVRLRAAAQREAGHPLPFPALAAVLSDPFAAGYAPVAAPERHAPRVAPLSADELDGHALLSEAAAGLGRLIDCVQAQLRTFSELSEFAAFAYADADLEDILSQARELRSGMQAWRAGDGEAAEGARQAIPGLRYALEDFLTYCEAMAAATGRPDLVSGAATWLHREMRSIVADVERLIDLLVRCQDPALA